MMTTPRTRAAIAALMAGVFTCVPGAWAQPAPAPTPYVMPATQVWNMASDSGEMYRIFVSAPVGGEPPRGGYPVLYVLDGNAYFGSFAQARWVQEYLPIGKSIVVGVGYPGDKAWDVRRMNDYTAQLRDPPPPETRAYAQHKSGARKEFLEFMTGKLRDEIAQRFAINPQRQSLFGHSFGGLFALYALYERPQAFQSIIAASPSMEWNAQNILDDERAFTTRMTTGKVGSTSRLLLIAGDRDTAGDPESVRLLSDRLERLSGWGLRARLLRYPNETHGSVPAQSVNDVLRFAFEQR